MPQERPEALMLLLVSISGSQFKLDHANGFHRSPSPLRPRARSNLSWKTLSHLRTHFGNLQNHS